MTKRYQSLLDKNIYNSTIVWLQDIDDNSVNEAEFCTAIQKSEGVEAAGEGVQLLNTS